MMSELEVKLPVLTAVALLYDVQESALARGQVGTVVEDLDENTALVEFSDDEGRAYSVAPCPWSALLPLKTSPLAA